MPMTLEEVKLFYPPAQILVTDSGEILVVTLFKDTDNTEYMNYTLVSREHYDNRRRYLRSRPVNDIQILLKAWMKVNFDLDIEDFHPCQ